ncbi:nucleotide exchange factor GrpE [Nocardiopsis trehalosi]|jgi:molecular chaperone GrpE|uniref:nucleotide exchange factor GrpE n=1 Tax=Nocardiopsis trehalosi TaxID=109329 RepID=UPI000836BDF6|nr:nucleotide exchange factor GrpE [Nocardiopsis trehalosi]
MALPENENGREHQGPVIRDKRRIDPETGELRTPEGAAEASPGEPEAVEPEADAAPGDPAGLAEARAQVEELTNDLKRVQAEYANYRKRVDRDRVAVREQALAQLVGDLVPILDDIGRAREHEELNGGFKSVGESLESLVAKLGLKKYGDKGDEFDPNVHEALTMVPSADVTVPTVVEVFQPGYLVGERVLRPARVVVAGPADDAAPAPGGTPEESPAEGAPGDGE